MAAFVLDHLWQSTLFAAFAGLLTLTFRRNSADVRFWVWFAAAAKFLVPFAPVAWAATRITAGLHAQPVAPPGVELARRALEPIAAQSGLPFLLPTVIPPLEQGLPDLRPCLGLAWAIGTTAVLWRRGRQWLALRMALARASPLALPTAVPAVEADPGGGPAVVGFLKPVLVLPRGLTERLTPGELEAVVEHEAHHARRRDNLLTLPLILAQALFWFHPLIWWIGRRLFSERERACDEAVLRSGVDAETYARGLLQVCRAALEPAPALAAAMGGGDLKLRIRRIMTGPPPRPLGASGGLTLGSAMTAAAALPVLAGIFAAPVAAPILARLSRPVAAATAPKPTAGPSPRLRRPAPARSAGRAAPASISAPAALLQAVAYASPAEPSMRLTRRMAAPAFQVEPPGAPAPRADDPAPSSADPNVLRALADRTAYVSGADFAGVRLDLRRATACPTAGVIEAERRLGGTVVSTAFDGRVRRFIEDALAGRPASHELSPALMRALDSNLSALRPALAGFGGPGEARLIGEDAAGRDVYLVRSGSAGYVLVMVDDLGRIQAALFCAAA